MHVCVLWVERGVPLFAPCINLTSDCVLNCARIFPADERTPQPHTYTRTRIHTHSHTLTYTHIRTHTRIQHSHPLQLAGKADASRVQQLEEQVDEQLNVMCAMRAKQVGLRASFVIYGCSCVPCVQIR